MIRHSAVLFAGAACALPASTAQPASFRQLDPLHFFEGRTESVTTVKVLAQKPHISRSRGVGRIKADGTLELVQYVKEEGKTEFQRLWRIRQSAPGRYVGAMSQAKGPVTIEKVGDSYVFRFAMDGNLKAEQWLTPQGDFTSARMRLTVRKFGIRVAHSEGWIRRVQPGDANAGLTRGWRLPSRLAAGSST